MATYAIGDIQGCYEAFEKLLAHIAFDPAGDKLWLVGDLVNRGPESLQTLRLIKSLGDSAVTVLGNHDLHLLMVAEGYARPHRSDTLHGILGAPDRDELLHWLHHQRLFHAEDNHAMVHAGLLPAWDIAKAGALAREVEQALQGPRCHEFMAHMYGNQPAAWRDDLSGWDRLRVITNAMTRMRLCSPGGEMELSHKGEMEHAPPGYLPWFDVPGRASRDTVLVCGHWSALGLVLRENLVALDTGCLWGGCLSAVRLQDRAVFQVSCAGLAGTTHWE